MIYFKNIIFTMLIALFLTACGEDTATQTDTTQSSTNGVPILSDFIINIDENSSGVAQNLGSIDIVSSGSSNISSFRLEGKGFSNFTIDKYGVISMSSTSLFSSTTTSSYELVAIATNESGDSAAASVFIQVLNASQPVMNDMVLNIDIYFSGVIGTIDASNFVRDGIGTVFDINNTRRYEFKDNLGGILSISTLNGVGTINLNTPLSESQSSYTVLVRPINVNDVAGPYSKILINLTNSGTSLGTIDYVGDDIYSASYIDSYFIVGYGIGGTIDYSGDRDVYEIYLPAAGDIIAYTLSSMDTYGRLYDATGRELASNDDNNITGGLDFRIEYFAAPAGTYYIEVSGLNDTVTGDFSVFAEY